MVKFYILVGLDSIKKFVKLCKALYIWRIPWPLDRIFHWNISHRLYIYKLFLTEIIDETRLPPTNEEINDFEEFIPTRSYHLTCLRPCIWLIAADLESCDVTAKKIVHGNKYKRVMIYYCISEILKKYRHSICVYWI